MNIFGTVLVSILVVVSNIRVKALKTDMEMGSMRAAFGHELFDPQSSMASLSFDQSRWLFLSFCSIMTKLRDCIISIRHVIIWSR